MNVEEETNEVQEETAWIPQPSKSCWASYHYPTNAQLGIVLRTYNYFLHFIQNDLKRFIS